MFNQNYDHNHFKIPKKQLDAMLKQATCEHPKVHSEIIWVCDDCGAHVQTNSKISTQQELNHNVKKKSE